MCLTPKTGKVLTTHKDKVVYKVLEKTDKNFVSPYRFFTYKIGKKYEVNEHYFNEKEHDIVEIYNGLHSYSSIKHARNMSFPLTSYEKLFVAIIPKGSKYLYGNNGDIVSNKLIVKRLYKKK